MIKALTVPPSDTVPDWVAELLGKGFNDVPQGLRRATLREVAPRLSMISAKYVDYKQIPPRSEFRPTGHDLGGTMLALELLVFEDETGVGIESEPPHPIETPSSSCSVALTTGSTPSG